MTTPSTGRGVVGSSWPRADHMNPVSRLSMLGVVREGSGAPQEGFKRGMTRSELHLWETTGRRVKPEETGQFGGCCNSLNGKQQPGPRQVRW